MLINLVYDSRALAAPQSFRDGIQTAANVLDATFTDNITINISVGYGEINGSPEPSGGASAGPTTGVFDTYSQVRSWLAQNASSDVQSGVAALPTGTSIQGQTQVAVWRAQERLMGQVLASDTGLDGRAGFATDISTNLLEGVALHELTHALGRVPYGSQPDVFDLYRFTSSGNRLFFGSVPATASYFSLDGGVTDLADYGRSSDPSDFLNSSGRTPNDPFNEFYNASTVQSLSHIDILQMEALGFHIAPQAPPAANPFTPASFAPDLNGDRTSDIVWRAASGDTVVATISGNVETNWHDIGIIPPWFQIAATGDFNGDGTIDVLWHASSSGDTTIATFQGGRYAAWSDLHNYSLNLQVAGAGDFNGDGTTDILWRAANGDTLVSTIQNNVQVQSTDLGVYPSFFDDVRIADFNGDGTSDILFHSSVSGDTTIATFHNDHQVSWTDLGNYSTAFRIAGLGDFNDDGTPDILWRRADTGDTAISTIQNGHEVQWTDLGIYTTQLDIAAVGDYNGDGTADVLFRDRSSGDTAIASIQNDNQVNWTNLAPATAAAFGDAPQVVWDNSAL